MIADEKGKKWSARSMPLLKSYFAPPNRKAREALGEDVTKVVGDPIVSGVLHSVGGLVAVLNEHRQVLAVNDSFLEMIGIDDPDAILGLRPGEILHCVHANEEPGGCGTSRYCSTCGAAVAIVAGLDTGMPTERLCALSTKRGDRTVDVALLVRSHRVVSEGTTFLLLFMQDITVQESRAALDRAFFHDVSNIITMLVQASELLEKTAPSELSGIIADASRQLHHEVAIQRSLAIENQSTYQPLMARVSVAALMEQLRQLFCHHRAAVGKGIVFREIPESLTLLTDYSLLSRILTNMIINGLEASKPSATVEVWVEQINGEEAVRFCVRNEGVIPGDVQRRVFQRNFTTKGQAGRGIGTFSMKLFGEEVLGGRVKFSSNPLDGTVFMFIHPA